jgi:hypothetical protein
LNLRDLVTRWGFEIRDEPLKRVEAHLGKIKQSMDFMIGTQVAKALISFEQRFSKWAHELNSVSIASNVSAEAIQKLAFAGAAFGTTQEEITGAMTSLTLKIYEAKRGVEGAQRAFSMAGFTGAQIRSWQNGNDALMALADRMKMTTDPIRRQAMAAELGVSANSKLYAFLMQGSGAMRKAAEEAKALGVVMSKDQVKGLVDAQNAMSKLMMVVQAIGKTIAADFAPSIKDAVNDILEFYKANRQLIEVNVKAWVDDFLYALGYLYGIFKFITKAVIEFAEAHPVLFRRITQIIAVVMTLGAALMAFGLIIGPLMTGLSALGTIFGLLTSLVPILGGALALLFSPIGLWIAGISLLLVTIRTLWDVFVNGTDIKDTMLGKGFMWILSIFDKIKQGFSWFANAIGFIGESIGGLIKKIPGKLFDFLMPKAEGDGKSAAVSTGLSNLNSIPSIASTPPSSIRSSTENKSTANNNMSVQAPITINVSSGGNSHETSQNIKDGLKDHLERVIRDTHRSMKSAEAY